MSDELESVSDEAATILKATRRLRKGRLDFSERSLQVLLGVLNAYERTRAFYLNIAETLAGGKSSE